jgi:putative ABC transport system permease protein
MVRSMDNRKSGYERGKRPSMIWCSTFREIKQSLGRFLAILAIVALGVGFFAGLKVCQSAMRKSTEQYLQKTEFYDYRLLSTVGFDASDIAVLREQEDVKAAEGVISFDIIVQDTDNSENVIKMYSLPITINQPVLVEGQMPQSPEECVVDANAYGSESIGKKLILAEDNTEDDLEKFTYQEYTITGIVQSPLYLQYERGTTSLGDGKISAFVYIMPEGFDVDYYTEAVVRFQKDFALYSDEYDVYVDEKEDAWEALVQILADKRYAVLKEDAETQLEEGKTELADKKAEAEEELADAKAQLDDAAAQIADGKQQIEDAKKELEEAQAEIERREEQLTAAETELAEQESQLNTAQIAVGVGVAQAMEQVADAVDNIVGSLGSDQSTGLDLSSLGSSLSGTSDTGSSSATDASSQISEVRSQLADGKAQIKTAKQQISAGWDAIASAKKQLAEAEQEIKDNEQKLADAETEYEEGLAEYEDGLAEFNTAIADAEKKIADGEAALEELEEPTVYILGRDTNIGYVCFESDSGIVDGIANVFPVFFFLVAALVCMTTMNRMVEEQRTQIGVLKALGYGEGTIMMKYIFYSGFAALMGWLIGFFGGTWFFPKVIWFAYGMMYRADKLLYVFDWKLGLVSLAGAMLCSVGTTWVSCRYELAEVSAELMRPKAPKAGKRVFLERIPFIWKRLKFLQKVSIRNIFRYKKRFFMMIVGISGCTALLVTGFGIRDSITNVATQQYTEIQLYDISATYTEGVTERNRKDLEELQEAGSISEFCFVEEKTVDMETEHGTKSIEMVVLDSSVDMQPYLNLHTTGKETVDYPTGNGVVLTHRIANDYEVEVGDVITLRDADLNTIEVEVSGICQNFVYNYAFVSADVIKAQLGTEPEYATAYVNVSEETDLHRTGTKLMKLDGVAAVTVNQDTMERFASMMSSLDVIVLVVIICAAGLAFIVLYNLTNINITERVREVATIKVLGFYEKETAAYVFRENKILAFLGGCVGLPLGKALHSFVISQITVDLIVFDVRILPVSYVYSMVLTMVFAWGVNRMMRKKLEQISMTESLKSVD